MSGSNAQIAAAQSILSQARRSLYLLLADDGQPSGDPAAETSVPDADPTSGVL
jgi:hypothetical protein